MGAFDDLLPSGSSPLKSGAFDDLIAPTPKRGFFEDLIPREEKGSFIPEIGKGVAGGAVTATGLSLKGMAGQQELAKADRTQMVLNALDTFKRIDAGEDVADITDPEVAGFVDLYKTQPPEERARMQEAFTKMAGYHLAQPVEETPLYQAGQAVQDFGTRNFRAAKDYENTWTRKITEGLGTTLPIFATAILSRGAGLAAGPMMSSGEAIDRAIQHGASKEQILQAVNLGGVPGVTETMPLDVILSKVPIAKLGPVVNAIIKVGASALAEGGQEALQQTMQNLISKYVYKPDQDITEGVVEAAAIGAIVGGGISTAATPLTYGREQPAPAPAAGLVINDPGGEGHGQTVTLDADQSGVPEGMRRVTLADGTPKVIGDRLLEPAAPAPTVPEPAAAPPGIVPEGAAPAEAILPPEEPAAPPPAAPPVAPAPPPVAPAAPSVAPPLTPEETAVAAALPQRIADVAERPDSPRLTPADRKSPIPNELIDEGKRTVEQSTGRESTFITTAEVDGKRTAVTGNVSDMVAANRVETQAVVEQITAGVPTPEIGAPAPLAGPPARAEGAPAPVPPPTAPGAPAAAEPRMTKAGFEEEVRRLKQRNVERREKAASLAAAGKPVRMASKTMPGQTALVSPDTAEPGKYRITRFDERGPFGHSVYNTLEQAIDDALVEGYDVAPGATAPAAAPAAAAAAPKAPVKRRDVKADTAVTPSGRQVPVTYAVVEADSLVASQRDEGGVNPSYPAELQPRDRTRGVSDQQINTIAQNLNPALLDNNASAGDGAPIISSDGVVESGNGRVLAIRRAYNQDLPSGATYRDYLESKGYPVEGMKNPVLVRVRQGQLAPDERAAFTREANERTTLAMSATERAMADASAMKPNVIALYRGGDIAEAGNRDFVRGFMQSVVSQNEQAAMVTPEGALSQEAIRRVQGALLAKAYGDADLVGSLIESPDNNIKAIGGAMMDVAGQWAQMRAEAASGDINPGADVTPFLLEAVRLIQRARNEGRPLAEFVSQTDIFSGTTIVPEAEMLLRLMFRNNVSWTQPAGREKLAEALRFYATEARKTSAGVDLLGEAAPPAHKILAEAKRRQYGEEEVQQKLPGGGRVAGPDVGAPARERAVEAQPRPQPETRPAVPREAAAEAAPEVELTPEAAMRAQVRAEGEARARAKAKAEGKPEPRFALTKLQALVHRALEARLNTPEIKAAIARMDAVPRTDLQEGFGTDEWFAERVYNFGTKEKPVNVRGLDEAIPLLVERARNLAASETKTKSFTPDQDRKMTIIIGPPGAGKSSIANPVAIRKKAAIADVDDAKQVIPEYQDGIGANAVHEESSVMGQEVLERLLGSGDNIVIPKIGHKLDSIEKLRAAAENFGYTVDLMLMDVTPQTAVDRMLNSFQKNRPAGQSYLFLGRCEAAARYLQSSKTSWEFRWLLASQIRRRFDKSIRSFGSSGERGCRRKV